MVEFHKDAWGNHKIQYLNTSTNEFVDIEENYVYNDVSNINRFVAYKNPFRYRSYYYDFETKLYYLNLRYYDPEIGRFINADDVSVLDLTNVAINGLNLYAYCLNNPVNEVDENGDLPSWLKWLIGAFVIALSAFLTIVTAGGFAAAGVAFASVFTGASVGGFAGFWAGVTIGAVVAGGIGILSGGISSVIQGNNFMEGAADGFMWGTIGGALGGGFGTMFKSVTVLYGANGKKVGSIIQMIGQALISSGTYTGQMFANGNKPTFIGLVTSIFAGAAGGAIAHTIFSTQFTINLLTAGLKISLDLFEKILANLQTKKIK